MTKTAKKTPLPLMKCIIQYLRNHATYALDDYSGIASISCNRRHKTRPKWK